MLSHSLGSHPIGIGTERSPNYEQADPTIYLHKIPDIIKAMSTFGRWVVALMFLFFCVMVGGFFLPSQWKVERAITINAEPVAIYPLVSNLKTGWAQWSAFDFEDPNIVYQYSGPEAGTGSSRTWTSKKMGNGSQTITAADPRRIEFELKMEGGFVIFGVLTIEPQNDRTTRVTWTDYGDVGRNPFYRYMAAMMDKMIGKTFEKSLATLKLKVEQK